MLYLGAIAVVVGTAIAIYFRFFLPNGLPPNPFITTSSPGLNDSEATPASSVANSASASPETVNSPLTKIALPNSGPTLELEYVLSGSDWAVHDLAMTPDGQTIIATDYSSLQKWQIENKNCNRLQACSPVGHFEVPSIWIYSVAISPDGNLLASGTWKKIKIWNLATGKSLGTILGHLNAVDSLAIDPSGQTLISGSSDQTIKIWSLTPANESALIANDSPLATLEGHTGAVTTLAIGADGQTLVSGSSDKTLKIWKLVNGGRSQASLIRTLDGHEDTVRSVAISPDGQLIASGSLDKTIKIWNAKTGRAIHTLSDHSGTILSVAISPDGKLLATGSADQTIKLWQLESGQLLETLDGHSEAVRVLMFSADGLHLVSGSTDKTIKIWRVQ